MIMERVHEKKKPNSVNRFNVLKNTITHFTQGDSYLKKYFHGWAYLWVGFTRAVKDLNLKT